MDTLSPATGPGCPPTDGQARVRTLLVVDDEENILSAMKRLLRRDGYHLLTANGGEAGLAILAREPVDVIVSDQRMPGMTGVEFLRRVKELYPETVRIVLSGYTELQSITDAINEGAIYKFLTKPWDDDQLRANIAEAFRTQELTRDNQRLSQELQIANRELAKTNLQLQALVQEKQHHLDRSETALDVLQEVLNQLPLPLLGVDDSGLVMAVNVEAEPLFGPLGGLLCYQAEDILPPTVLEALHNAGGPPQTLELGGQTWQVLCRSIGQHSQARGKLLFFFPEANRHG